MGRIENTVFISYRRTNLPWALAIYQDLTAHGYDAFFDFESVNSGDFEQVILGNIRARAHFVVVLTPSMLERINEPNDWVRREIETALDEKRNIVPLFFEGFNFGDPSIAEHINGKLLLLKKYGGFDVPVSFFSEAMDRLRNRYLNIALDAVLHPVSATVQMEVQKQQMAAIEAKEVKEKELDAQKWYEQACKHWQDKNYDESIRCATEAIRLKPDFVEAYNRRGSAKKRKGDFDSAIKDYAKSIHLKPDYAVAYYNRGMAYYNNGDLDKAINDYTETIHLKPDYLNAYYYRGIAYFDKGELDDAINDYTEVIRFKPDNIRAYYNRGIAFSCKDDLDNAINDYAEVIRVEPGFANVYYNCAIIWEQKENYYVAILNYQKYLDLGGGSENGDQDKVEKYIRELKTKIK